MPYIFFNHSYNYFVLLCQIISWNFSFIFVKRKLKLYARNSIRSWSADNFCLQN